MSSTPENQPRPDPTTGWASPPSALDKRRAKLQNARQVDEDAAAAVSDVDDALRDNTESIRQNDASLTILRDRVAELEKALKADAKTGSKLRVARDRARQVRAKAQQKVVAAEDRYDQAVLADLLRREKDHDLSAHPDRHPGLTPPATTTDESGTDPASSSEPAGEHRPATTTSPRAPM